MTQSPLVSYVIATYNRPGDLAETLESVLDQEYEPLEVVVVCNSTDETPSLFEAGARFDRDRVRYFHYPERMGVPKARNVGYEHARGDILVTLDDDAVLRDAGATGRVVSLLEAHDEVGVLAFQCRDYYSGELNLHETPDPPELEMTPAQEYRAANFVGVGNAIRRSTLEAAGGYPEDFVYGFEEMDLSFRVHDTGYDILYTPEVTVYHKKAATGRRTALETRERLVENRIKLAVRNLPVHYVLFTALIWSAYAAALTRRPSSLARIYRRLYENRDELLEARSVVGPQTIDRVKARRAMLFLWWYGPHPGRLLGPEGNRERLMWEV